jgi:Family of unknown function (DUF5320)
MPFGDGTGPLGQAPGTGLGAGFCSGYGAPGSMNRSGGFAGRGVGCRGRRNRQGAFGRPFVSPDQGDEVGALKAQAGFFERALANIRKRIEGLEAKTNSE